MTQMSTRGVPSANDLPDASVQPIVVASHQRSGTHLLLDLLRRQFRECNSWKWPLENANRLYLSFEALHLSTGRVAISSPKALNLLARTPRPLVKMHQPHPSWQGVAHASQAFRESPWMAWALQAGTLFYVVRDVRDVMCSHFLMYTKARRLNDITISDFLRGHGRPYSRVQYWVEHVQSWIEQNGVCTLKFEEIVNAPQVTLERIGRHVGLKPLRRMPYLPPRNRNVWWSRWQRLFSIRPGSTAIIGLAKGTKRRRWQEMLSQEDLNYIDTIAGPMLERLGYQQDQVDQTAGSPSRKFENGG